MRSGAGPLLPMLLLLLLVALSPGLTRAGPVNRQAGSPNNLRLDGRNQSHTEQSVCVNDDVLYQPGDPMPAPDPCSRCVCRPPASLCEPLACDKKPGCKALQRPGQCCPEYQCECERDGRVYQNGERLEGAGGPCQACYCRGGEVVCTAVECYRRADCEPQHVPGRCCPKYDHCPPLAMEAADASRSQHHTRAQFQPAGEPEPSADQDLGASNVAEERVQAVAAGPEPAPAAEELSPAAGTPAAPSPDGLEPAIPAPPASPVAEVAPLSASSDLAAPASESSPAASASPEETPTSSVATEAAADKPAPSPATSPDSVPAIRIDVPLVPWRGVENAVAATEKTAAEATTVGSGSAETDATERATEESETETAAEGSGEFGAATEQTTVEDRVEEAATETLKSQDPDEIPQSDGPALRSPVAAAEEPPKDAAEAGEPSEESEEPTTTAAYARTDTLDEMTTSEPEEEDSRSTDEPQGTAGPGATDQELFTEVVGSDSSEAPLASESSTDSSPEYKELEELQRDSGSRPAPAVSSSGQGSSSSGSSGSGSSESASQVLATNVQTDTVRLSASNSALDSSGGGSGSGSGSFALSEPSSADSTESSDSTELPETTDSLLSSSEEPSEASHSSEAHSDRSKPEDDPDKTKDDEHINIVLDTETTDDGGPPILLIGDDLANHQMDIVMATAPGDGGPDAATKVPGSMPPATPEPDGTTEAGSTPSDEMVLSDAPLPGQAAPADGPRPGESLADSPGQLRGKPADDRVDSRDEQTTFQEAQDAAAATTEGSGEISTEAPEREAVTNRAAEAAASEEPATETLAGDATSPPEPEAVGEKLLPLAEEALEEATGQPATTDPQQETKAGEEAEEHGATTGLPADDDTPALPGALLKSGVLANEATPVDKQSDEITPIPSTTLGPETATALSDVAEIEQNDSPATEDLGPDATSGEKPATTEEPAQETTVEDESSTLDPLVESPSTQQLISEELMLGDQPLLVSRIEGSAESNSEPPATEAESTSTTEAADTQTETQPQAADTTVAASTLPPTPPANLSAGDSSSKINPEVLELKPSSPATAAPSNATEALPADADGTTLSPEWLKSENATEAPAAAAPALAPAQADHVLPAASHGALARFASPDEVGKKDLFILEDFFTKLYRHQIVTDDTKH